MQYVENVKSLVVNLLLALPIARRLVTRTHVTGIYTNIEAAHELYDFFESLVPSQGKVVLELGPGKNLETISLAKQNGASYALAADIISYHDTSFARQKGVDYRLFDGLRIPLPDESIDVVWGCYCLQHFRDPATMLAEIRRVLRPGGKLVCRVDLRDHYHIPHPGREYECLRYSDWFWKCLAWYRSSYVNRLRFTDWVTLTESIGLTPIVLDKHQDAQILADNRRHIYLSHLKEIDISTFRFDAVFQRR